MIGYVMLGTNDLERGAAFYDALFGLLGAGRMMEEEGKFIAWSAGEQSVGLGLCRPHDGNPATVGNGVMVAFMADSREKVDEVYEKAMELGASDEGPPGQRSDGFYAAYFRDLDGNKLNAFFMG